MTFSEEIIQIRGLRVNFLEDGQSNQRALLLIHGGIGDARLHWGAIMPALADDGFHVFAPDLPGFSKSDVLPQMHTSNMINWIKDFLDHQGIEQAVIIGNSFGGLLARLFAAAHPAQVPALILLNGGGVPEMPGIMQILEGIPGISSMIFSLFSNIGTSPNTLKRMLRHQEILTETFLKEARAARGGYSRLLRMFVGSPMPREQAPIVPTLILWGTDDQIAVLSEAEAIKASIPGAVLTEIKDCGHMPQLETSDVFIWQVNMFLDKLSRPARSEQSSPGILPTLPS